MSSGGRAESTHHSLHSPSNIIRNTVPESSGQSAFKASKQKADKRVHFGPDDFPFDEQEQSKMPVKSSSQKLSGVIKKNKKLKIEEDYDDCGDTLSTELDEDDVVPTIVALNIGADGESSESEIEEHYESIFDSTYLTNMGMGSSFRPECEPASSSQSGPSNSRHFFATLHGMMSYLAQLESGDDICELFGTDANVSSAKPLTGTR